MWAGPACRARPGFGRGRPHKAGMAAGAAGGVETGVAPPTLHRAQVAQGPQSRSCARGRGPCRGRHAWGRRGCPAGRCSSQADAGSGGTARGSLALGTSRLRRGQGRTPAASLPPWARPRPPRRPRRRRHPSRRAAASAGTAAAAAAAVAWRSWGGLCRWRREGGRWSRCWRSNGPGGPALAAGCSAASRGQCHGPAVRRPPPATTASRRLHPGRHPGQCIWSSPWREPGAPPGSMSSCSCPATRCGTPRRQHRCGRSLVWAPPGQRSSRWAQASASRRGPCSNGTARVPVMVHSLCSIGASEAVRVGACM